MNVTITGNVPAAGTVAGNPNGDVMAKSGPVTEQTKSVIATPWPPTSENVTEDVIEPPGGATKFRVVPSAGFWLPAAAAAKTSQLTG